MARYFKCAKDETHEPFESKFLKGDNCPTCGSYTELRHYYPVGAIFKGKGFYVNDYPKNGK